MYFSTEIKRHADLWYVMQVRAGRELEIKKKLVGEENDYKIKDLIIPEAIEVEHDLVDDDDKNRYKMFLGYIFIKICLDYSKYTDILSIEDIYRFLGSLYKKEKNLIYIPSFVPEREVKNVKKYLNYQTKISKKNLFKIGDTVIIKDGDLANLEGVIIEIKNDNAKINPRLFQKPVRVSINKLIHASNLQNSV